MERQADGATVWEHLEDLRRKILGVLAFAAVAFLGCWFFLSQRIVEALVALSDRPAYYLSVFEPFFTRFRVSAWSAAFASLPLALVQAVRFVVPGLHRGERRAFAGAVAAFAVLAGGAGFLLYRFSPLLLSLFLEAFASPAVEMHLSISTFVTFYLMLAGSALVMVMVPAATFLLLKTGVLSPRAVGRARRWLVPVFLVVAAVITPPDPASMLIVFVPLWGVFELSLLVFRLTLGRARKPAG